MTTTPTGDASSHEPTGDSVVALEPLAAILERSCGLAPGDAAVLARHCVLRDYRPGEAIVREGERASAIHWIAAGRADVCRETASEGQLRLVELHPGAVIGEIAFLRDDPAAAYSATVVAQDGMTGASIPHARLRGDPALQPVSERLARHFGRIAAERLSATTAFTAEAMSAAIARERRLARHLSVVIMLMAVFVVLSNSRPDLGRALAALELGEVAFTSLFYFVYVGAIGVVFRWLIRALGEAPEALGLQLHDWRRQLAAGLAWSLPGLVVAAAMRAWLYPREPVLAIHARDGGEALLTPAALALLVGYVVVLCPVQEYITRAGVQAPILNAFGASRARLGIVVSTLVAAVTFGAMHIAYGVWPVLLTTLVGIYWGIAFVHTRSVVAISTSHVVLGVAAFYWFGLIR
ncbi:MAG: cyclic nucleotide-binding domain-containing protein [Alphaproteobacteria bacterium]|nr:cyclic nucleotide-binding domain-containing protein [Alphaproteobacteria bacterium]